MKNSVKVKVLRPFRNPVRNRMAEVDAIMSVPKNRFWFKRLQEGDCEIYKAPKKPKKVFESKPKDESKSKDESKPKKGSE